MFAAPPQRRRRAVSLTPMIDVVFLLLIFFMLASRFGTDMHIPLAAGGGAGDYQGAPRLVTVTADGVTLNGIALPESVLAAQVTALMPTPTDMVVVRPAEDADLARLVAVMDVLRQAGIGNLVMVE